MPLKHITEEEGAPGRVLKRLIPSLFLLLLLLHYSKILSLSLSRSFSVVATLVLSHLFFFSVLIVIGILFFGSGNFGVSPEFDRKCFLLDSALTWEIWVIWLVSSRSHISGEYIVGFINFIWILLFFSAIMEFLIWDSCFPSRSLLTSDFQKLSP